MQILIPLIGIFAVGLLVYYVSLLMGDNGQ